MGWRDLFRRKRTPGLPDCENWQAGDLAECIVGGDWFRENFEPGTGPVLGERIIVEGVSIGQIANGTRQIRGLHLRGYPSRYQASAFRKIQPLADQATRCEDEFLQLLRKTPAPAPEKAA